MRAVVARELEGAQPQVVVDVGAFTEAVSYTHLTLPTSDLV